MRSEGIEVLLNFHIVYMELLKRDMGRFQGHVFALQLIGRPTDFWPNAVCANKLGSAMFMIH